jgi:tetratricopeptide (TPR) repeat protein
MKNYFILIPISILLIFFLTLLPVKTETVNNQATPNILKNYETINIYIKLKPYKGKMFLHEDGKIYTAIEDLSKVLNFEYNYDKENKILTINGNKYDYEYLLKNKKILYVSLTSCCLYLGYKVNYDSATNILDVSKSGVTTYSHAITPCPASGDFPADMSSDYEEGYELYRAGKHKECIEYFDKVLANDSTNTTAWNCKGLALTYQGIYDEAIKCYNKVLGINPNHARAWHNKGWALSFQGKDKEAMECYNKALILDPNYAFTWNNKGILLTNDGKYDEAIKCYDKALEIDPVYINALNNKGTALYYQRKHEEAIKCYDKSLELSPNNVNAKNGKENALKALGK